MALPITSFFAGVCGLILVPLIYNVTKLRRKHRIAIGAIKTEEYRRKDGALSNFLSTTPFVLILMGLIEVGSEFSCLLWFFGAAYIVARLAHIYSLYHYEQKTGRYYVRVIGMSTTFFVIVAFSALNLYISLRSL